MFKLDLEKAEEPEIKLPTSIGSQKSKKIPENHLLLLYWLCQSLCGPQQTLENSSRDGNTRHLTCFLRNLYAGQEATVRTGHGTTDGFHIKKGVRQSCILSPCLFNLYAEYIMRNAGLDEAQAGIKIARRNINNLRYADDHYGRKRRRTKEPIDESESGEWNSLKLNIQKTKIMASGPIISWQIDGETMETVTDFIGLQNPCRCWLQPWN